MEKTHSTDSKAEQRVWQIAEHGEDPGHSRPAPEVLHGAPEADVATELAAFTALDDLQVNLFAAEKEGLTSPRQNKEGYSIVQVVTDEGRDIQGYKGRTKESQESGDLVVKELATGKLLNIDKDRIEDKTVTGSAMPDGLTTSLSRPQLLDLVRYLSEH